MKSESWHLLCKIFSENPYHHSHPNIIAYKEAFIEDSSSSLCLVMEFANDGDLYEKIVNHTKKRTLFSENQIWGIFISMVKALKVLH